MRTRCTTALLDNLRKNYGVTTLGFFLAQDQWDYRRKLEDVGYQKMPHADYDETHDFKKDCQKISVG